MRFVCVNWLFPIFIFFFFSSRRRHTRCSRDWSSDVCSSDLYQMFARELTMHGSRLYTRAAWEEAIRLAASGAVPLAPLVSRRIPLEALTEGMQAALGGTNVMKVLIEL